jgi:hypothetical protein
VVVLEQLGRPRADRVQLVDTAVDDGEVHIEGACQIFLANAFVNRPAQHLALLHGREAVDPMVLGIGLEVLGNQAGCCVIAKFLERQNAEVAVQYHLPGLVQIWLYQRQRLDQAYEQHRAGLALRV